ncbi:hypothetical protein GMLC_02240 [Geomonas limicola]|uniref:Ice-binding protein C-terminal domain-containing protein n=1 Tax=Geomonas limicola TaxID=2740186 RepID=A0A6V8N288_9BACT|nr:PEP-CTERM sorting domain-containing protein [Geomonas limicola]GFO66645.1 hypothetical protein GMLC_02240 [Geomonas limicola]
MKKTTGTVLALLTLICALWVAPAFATNYNITGYTASLLVTDPVGNVLGGDTGLNGYYSLDLVGSGGANLSGTLTLFQANADYSRNLVIPAVLYSAALIDKFYFTLVGDDFTLGSDLGGDMLRFNYAALPTDPNYPDVFTARALNLGNGNVFVNQFFNEQYYASGPDGNPTNPITAYGAILSDGFTATDVNGNFIDMVIDDASAPVPEPSTFLLLGLGLAGLGVLRRRNSCA